MERWRALWPGRDDLRAMIVLALPVVTVQLGQMGLGVVDTMIVGRVSAQALAAVALGNLVVFGVSAFAAGSMMALDPLVAQAVGGGERHLVARSLQRGLLLATVLAVPTGLLMACGRPLLTLLRQPAEVIPVAASYASICVLGLWPLLVFTVFRQTLQGMSRVRPVVVAIVAANVVNAVLDYMLVFGRCGFPALGALGSAWASTACRWLMLAGVLVAGRPVLVPLVRRLDRASAELTPLLRLARLGAPMGLQRLLEYFVFASIAMLMGWMGAVQMAAHQVTISLAALTYMVPVGVSAAAAVRVGQAVGRGDRHGVRQATTAALLCGAAFMACCAGMFLTVPGFLAGLFTSAAEVRAVAATLIVVAGFFQVVDGLQVVAAGVLRGLGDTRSHLLASVLGFWLIGFPVSLLLGFKAELGPPGLWLGFVAGLAAVAVMLLVRMVSLLRRPLSRVSLDT